MVDLKPFKIGLTGGVGSGKSTVATSFAALGVPIIDTDQISRGLTVSGGAAINQISCSFGAEFIDANGALNRSKMRDLIFQDAAQRERLEHIIHPLIWKEADAQLATLQAFPYVVIEIPLLAESRTARQRVDRILVVDCDQRTQISRLMQTRNLSNDQACRVIQHQASRQMRLAIADDVIFNEGHLSSLKDAVSRLDGIYTDRK